MAKLYGPVVDLMRMVGNEMNARFSGKSVIVAGGTGGLGRAVSLAFLEEGAKVEFEVTKGPKGLQAANVSMAA